MKKTLIAIMLVCSLLCALISCGKQSDELTLDEALNAFDEDIFVIKHYNTTQIEEIKSQALEIMALKGDISAVIHIMDQRGPTKEDLTWTYIYEFTEKSDAELFVENYVKPFASSREKCKYVYDGKVVVFGIDPAISTINTK